MQNLNKKINFDILIYYFMIEIGPKLVKNIKCGYITIEKEEENKKSKSDLNDIVKGKWEYKSEEPKSAIKFFTNHQKKLSNCLMIILKLHLRLNIDKFIENDLKY